MSSVTDLIREMERTRFYGSLEIKFEAGRVVVVKKTETIKPAERNYRDSRGNSNGYDS
jgi:hypothetical protein